MIKISIITTTFNAQSLLERTLDSIRRAKDADVEYIVVDGGSGDGTVELFAQNRDLIDVFISEPDDGVYHGLNKGILLASGDIIGIVHAGSVLVDGAIHEVKELARKTELGKLIAGSAEFVGNGKKQQLIRSSIPLLSPNNTQVLHEAVFVPRLFFAQYGLYDLSYRISSDFAWVSRVISAGVKVEYSDVVFIAYTGGWGLSGDHEMFWKKIRDHYRVMARDLGPMYAGYRYVKRVFLHLAVLVRFLISKQGQKGVS